MRYAEYKNVCEILKRRLKTLELALSLADGPPSRFSGLLAQRQLCKDLLQELQETTQKEIGT